MLKNKPALKVCILSTMYPRFRNDTRGLMVYETNRILSKQGVNVAVVAPNSDRYKGFEVMDRVSVNRFSYFFPTTMQRLAYGAGIPTNLRKSFLAKLQVPFFGLSFLLKAISVGKKCDIIHAQWFESGFIALLAKFFVRKPVVVTARRVGRGKLMTAINRFVLKNADYVIFNSSFTEEESLKIAKPKRYSIVHNSIDIDKFRPAKSGISFRKKLGISPKTKVISFLGLLVEKKGIKYLISAFKDIQQKHPDSVLLIGGSGPEELALRQQAKSFGLQQKVRFLGELKADETPGFYNSSDIFVLPSIIDSKGETETLGVVLLEAMACEVPVIGSNCGGIVDIITKDTGILSKQKDSKDLYHKIDYLLSNIKKRKSLAKNSRKSIIERFSPESQAKKTIEIYQKLMRKI